MAPVSTRPTLLFYQPQQHVVACIICGETVRPDCATAGSLYAGGQQAYACSIHLANRRVWVPGWASFESVQADGTAPRTAARPVHLPVATGLPAASLEMA